MYICHFLTQGHWWGKNFTPPYPIFLHSVYIFLGGYIYP